MKRKLFLHFFLFCSVLQNSFVFRRKKITYKYSQHNYRECYLLAYEYVKIYNNINIKKKGIFKANSTDSSKLDMKY
jgi:hypothetical protein